MTCAFIPASVSTNVTGLFRRRYVDESLLYRAGAMLFWLLLCCCGCDGATDATKRRVRMTKEEMNSRVQTVLTLEESIGLACRSRYYRVGRWHLCRGVDPAAIPHIRRLLEDENFKDCWPSCVEALAFVGGDTEANLLNDILSRKYVTSSNASDQETFYSTILALGFMARRDVKTAREIVCRYTQADFWSETQQPWIQYDFRGEHGWARANALYGRLICEWSVNEEIKAVVAEGGQCFEGSGKTAALEKVLRRLEEAEMQEITKAEKLELAGYFKKSGIQVR